MNTGEFYISYDHAHIIYILNVYIYDSADVALPKEQLFPNVATW